MPDDKVFKLRQEDKAFKLRQEDIERKLDDHISESKKHRDQQQENFDKLLNCQIENTEAIAQLTAATAGIIEVYSASQGAIKVGAAVGRFVKWATGIGVICYAWFHYPTG